MSLPAIIFKTSSTTTLTEKPLPCLISANGGIRDDIVKKFQLGYSTTASDALAQEAMRKGYKKEFLLKTGLCYEKEDGSLRDRFWGRVIFPWFNISGKVLGFGGRVLDSRTKGVNQNTSIRPNPKFSVNEKNYMAFIRLKLPL